MHPVYTSLVSGLAQLMPLLVAAAVAYLVPAIRARVRSKLAADSLALLTSTTGMLVMGAADEVRRLKDPSLPGEWSPMMARAIRERVVRDVRVMGSGALSDLGRVQNLTPEALERLVHQLVEAQVESLRPFPAPAPALNVAVAAASPEGATQAVVAAIGAGAEGGGL